MRLGHLTRGWWAVGVDWWDGREVALREVSGRKLSTRVGIGVAVSDGYVHMHMHVEQCGEDNAGLVIIRAVCRGKAVPVPRWLVGVLSFCMHNT